MWSNVPREEKQNLVVAGLNKMKGYLSAENSFYLIRPQKQWAAMAFFWAQAFCKVTHKPNQVNCIAGENRD
jgi:malate synthase